MRVLKITGAFAALLLATAGQATAATVLSVGWNSGCGASTCFAANNLFTQTFSASSFAGRVNITQLLLSRDVLGSMGGHMFNLSFQVNGHEVGTWGDWNMGSVAGDNLSFSGSALNWNPADGDLVLVLELVAPNGERLRGGFDGFYFDTDSPPQQQSAPDPNTDPGEGGGTQDDGGGTQDYGGGTEGGGFQSFSLVQTAVPEPATWALMLGGFGLCGAALRRRRTPVTA